jgi:hypothetical protein
VGIGAESTSTAPTLGGAGVGGALAEASGSRTSTGGVTLTPAVGGEGAALAISAALECAFSHQSVPPSAASAPAPSTEPTTNAGLAGLVGAAGRKETPAALVDSARAGTIDGGGSGLLRIWLRNPIGP